MNVGVLHPGAMGSALAGAIRQPVYWAGHGRSRESCERAERQDLIDVGSVESLAEQSEVLISVCPPHAAVDLASQVAGRGYRGIYLDANAIAPAESVKIGQMFERYVDGGIIGGPPHEAGTTRFYLAAGDRMQDVETVAQLWEGSPLDVRVLDKGVGAASALKMAYAGWTKGSSALLLAIRSYAESAGVGPELVEEWRLSIPELPTRTERSASGVGPKAWRFGGEMAQIAAALEAEGLPEGFHLAAQDLYERLALLKGSDRPSLEEVLTLLAQGRPATD
jgi:3-hydroxyisobutyrate dehydrogenase-like beta-hydroxyacid dehydrogenase